MVTVVLVITAFIALVNGFNPNYHPANDFVTNPTIGERLAGWQVLGNGRRCDIVRPQIRTFGYCYNDENEKKGINTTKERGWVREVIQQWEKCGGIKINEEKVCRKGPDFVTITVGNYGPVLYPDVDTATCTIKGFNMNLDFYTFGVNIESYKVTEKVRKSNVQMYALHEFGHFLGFDHEHNRADRGECYYKVDQNNIGSNAIFGNTIITKQYDIESIMNYCRPNVHYKPYLSQLDKEGIRAKYGGGNQAECDAVTKPWTWADGDGLDASTLASLNGGSSKPSGGNQGGVCADVASKQDCDKMKGNCKDEGMKYWCPKTCKYC